MFNKLVYLLLFYM